MSRSRRRTMAYGRSTSSRMGRASYDQRKDAIKKAQREGTPVPRCHERAKQQTLLDYEDLLRMILRGESYYSTDLREKRIRQDFYNFVENLIGKDKAFDYWMNGVGVEDALMENLIDRFAYKIYVKDLSK